MFKLFSPKPLGRGLESFIWLFALVLLPGCQTGPPLPPADLSIPGWRSHSGQAVWHRADGTEMAGEILIATRPTGEEYIQFTKNPFPVMTLQRSAAGWQLQIPLEKKRYSGRGTPPARLIFWQLLRALRGETLGRGWSWTPAASGRGGSPSLLETGQQWRLVNLRTGESLEGSLSP